MSAIAKTIRRIEEAGGFFALPRMFFRERKLAAGKLVGKDDYGNKYYEDSDKHWGAHRRVSYGEESFDASQVPAEWHRWLHYITDDVPARHTVKKTWQLPHEDNVSGTPLEYTPYSTTKPKIEAWKPTNKN